MKFTCEKAMLQNANSIAGRAVPSKSPISALEGFLISADESIRITGYDLKKAISTTIEGEVAEPGTVVVNARFFSEMIRRMPEGPVTFTCDENNNVTVKCGKSEYNFISLDFREYPEMPSFEKINSIEIPMNILKNMISRTLFAVSKEEIRPVYTGTLFEIEENELTLVSVDGYRLARRREKIENSHLENCSFVVPGFTLSDIEKICDDSDEKVTISIGDKHISFNLGNSVVISRRLEGDFLNHKKSVPENFRYILKVERTELLSVIDRVSLMLSERTGNPVRITFDDGTVNCLCITPVGKAEDICICEGNGEGLEMGFNDRYLTDALKAAECDELSICLNTASSPCVIKAAKGEEKFTYMILPVRLHTN